MSDFDSFLRERDICVKSWSQLIAGRRWELNLKAKHPHYNTSYKRTTICDLQLSKFELILQCCAYCLLKNSVLFCTDTCIMFDLHLIHSTTFVTSDFSSNYKFYNNSYHDEFLYKQMLGRNCNFIRIYILEHIRFNMPTNYLHCH